jgi:hypothetical protein
MQTDLRYNGFHQVNNIREFIFHSDTGEANDVAQSICVAADVTLFKKYAVGIQEGPTLCLRKLALKGDSFSEGDGTFGSFYLTEDDVRMFAEDQREKRKKGTHRR